MAVRIKTISNELLGTKKPESRNSHKPAAASGASGQVNKILELEWEALGRKLNKHPGNGVNGSDVEKLRRQLKEKDEMLRQANQKIAALKKQLSALQVKQQAHRPQQVNPNKYKAPARA